MTNTALHPATTTALHDLADVTAAWLDKADLTCEAAAVRSLPPIGDLDALAAASPAVQPLMMVAYRRAGVVAWPEAQPGIDAARDALAAMLAAVDPYLHTDDLREVVDQYAGWLWTIACYAAHAAVTNPTR